MGTQQPQCYIDVSAVPCSSDQQGLARQARFENVRQVAVQCPAHQAAPMRQLLLCCQGNITQNSTAGRQGK